jgi:hypothetical protein
MTSGVESDARQADNAWCVPQRMEAIMGRPKELTEEERDSLRRQGLRPIEIWVPDLEAPGMDVELRRQAAAVAEADEKDDIFEWLAALQATEGREGSN